MNGWLLGAGLFGLPLAVCAAEVAATLDWAGRVTLGTPVSGVVQAVLVQPGERVAKGQELVRLDPRSFEAALAGAEARRDRSTPERAEAEREVERAQELYDRTVLSNHELELARIALARADAEQRMAEAAVEQARLDLEYSVVRAPYDALVLERLVEPGQTIVTRERSVPMVTLAETGRFIARVDVEPEIAAALEPGREVELSVGADTGKGRVERVHFDPLPGANGPRHRVDVAVPVPAGVTWRRGQAVTLRLPDPGP